MPGKITELAALTGAAAATTDLIEAVDVSDTSMAASGTNKKMALSELATFVGASVTVPAPVGTKMSALTALTGAGAAGTDIVEVVDVSDTTMAASGTNKKITLTELVTFLNANGIMVANDSITNTKIAPMPAATLKGNSTGATAGPQDLTVTETLAMLDAGGTGNWHRYTFSTTTTGAPATNGLRFNNATLASVTQIAVNYSAVDIDVKTRLLQHGAGERFYLQGVLSSAANGFFRVTATPTDVTTYATIPVVYESGAGTFTNNLDIMAGFITEPKVTAINAQTGTTYTAVWSDIYKMITLTNASAITFNLPTNATTSFPIGATIDIVQLGAGQVTVASPGTPTVNATPSRLLRAQYSAATLIKYATDTWLLVGDLA